MKYKDSQGNFQDIYVKVGDNIPVGGEMDFDGDNIPVGWEEVDNPNNYSTTEQKVGTWIDGKPLYRKVVEIPNTTISSSSTTAITINVGNVNVTDVRGYVYVATSNYRYSINGCRTFDFGWRYDGNNKNMQLIVGTSMSAEGSINGVAIVEYTKTTD